MAPNNTHSEAQAGRRSGAGALIGGTLFIVLITACAMIIAYNGLFALAEYGGGEKTSPHVFPVAYTLLVLMAFWVSYMLRDAAPRDRLWIDVGLIPFLIVFAAAVMAMTNIGMFDPETGTFPERVANVVVAVAPLVPVLIAILLWITVRAHLRRRSRAVQRPSPSADRTTVLHGRGPGPEDPEPAPLQTRLLSFGNEPEDETEEFSSVDRPRAEADTVPFDSPREEPEDPVSLHRPTSEFQGTESDTEAAVAAETPPTHLPDSRTESDGSDDFEDSPAAAPLPRRSRNRGNPIKYAAEHPPVVSGPATPTPEPPEEEFAPPEGPEDPMDEGFEHEPSPGDPTTDEAEAPAIPTEARTAPESPAGTVEGGGQNAATTPTERVEEVAASTDTLAEDDTEPDSDDESTFVLWEPPTEDDDRSILADYVPPVWTPPEEDTPSLLAEQTPTDSPPPVHDTGPEVHAAFHRLDSSPTPPEGDDGDEVGNGWVRAEAERPETQHLTAQERVDEEDGDPLPEVEELPAQGSEPQRKPEARPASTSGGPLRKRPMMLKPPRPPMPDFESGPPSRRVRSEPLRPED